MAGDEQAGAEDPTDEEIEAAAARLREQGYPMAASLTEADCERLAEEAEVGYDVAHIVVVTPGSRERMVTQPLLIPRPLLEAIAAQADREWISVSAFIRRAIARELGWELP